MDKTVVFIGGTAYSGSTLLNLVIANDPQGFSCGEVHAFVHPYLDYHWRPNCGCGDLDCRFWQPYGDIRPDSVHRWLFERVPGIRLVVDSSKDVGWIRPNAVRLQRRDIIVHKILVWKTPAEFLASRQKRGQLAGWANSWIYYHRAFLAAFPDCVTVRYESLVSDPATLDAICKVVGIANFPGKTEYWNKEQHTLFGNSSARIHLVSEASSEYTRMRTELDNQSSQEKASTGEHQSIRYLKADASLESNASAKDIAMFARIQHEIELRDVKQKAESNIGTERPYPWIWLAPYYVLQKSTKALRCGVSRMKHVLNGGHPSD